MEAIYRDSLSNLRAHPGPVSEGEKGNALMDKQLEVVIRPVLENDLPVIAELDQEAFSAYGTAEDPQTFALRYQAFPAGFIVLTEDDRIVAYGCGEKWLTEREPGLGENPLETHHPDGRIFCITGMAVRLRHRRKGYGLAVLERLIEIARQEGCTKILLETTHAQGLYLKRGFRKVGSREEWGIILDVLVLDNIQP